MMSEVETVASIRQYINRLDDSVSSERLKSLLELQTLSKTFPKLVGENCIQRLFVFLYEQGSTEEYQETLDLIIRLVKCKDTSISTNNVALVLQETRNVELLLDMLEHEDLAVAVMVNQVLTEIHSRDNASLERLIQDCPAGMNKLLQRLSDHLREEVRNQALVFVKQLTAHNEEVKKTVVFNEGFEILFGIIRLEGGVEGSGPVIIDCLEICRNLLTESETCQRFFFGMGIGWTMQIVEFFTPEILEIDVGGEESQPWFEDVSRARCASTALEVLVAALGTVNVKHQNAVVLSSQSIVPAVCHWLVRRGPVGMARSALLFLECAVIQNQEVASRILNTFLVFHASRKGRTVPLDSDVGNYINSWKMSLKEERCCINVPLLLTESYIYSYESWRGICDIEGTSVPKTLYLDIFEQLLRTEDQYAGLIIQYILAPVMQDESDNEAYDNSLEMAQSLGKFVISIIYDSCRQLLAETNSAKSVPATAERASNILVVLFLHGGVIARELATALTTAHCQKASTSKFRSTDTQSFLPFLLNCVGRINRLQGSQTLVSSILWVLTVAAHECDRATKLVGYCFDMNGLLSLYCCLFSLIFYVCQDAG